MLCIVVGKLFVALILMALFSENGVNANKSDMLLLGVRATSHLSERLTAKRVTVNEVSSHLCTCKILTLIIVKTYLQTGR